MSHMPEAVWPLYSSALHNTKTTASCYTLDFLIPRLFIPKPLTSKVSDFMTPVVLGHLRTAVLFCYALRYSDFTM